MAFANIRAALDGVADGQPVVINEALLGPGGAIELIKACLETSEIDIQHASVATESSCVTVRGQSSLLNIKQPVQVEMEISNRDGDLSLWMIATLPADWTFGQSFPKLAPYLRFGGIDAGYQPSFLNELAFTDARLVFATHAGPRDPFPDSFETGLNFSATLRPSGLLAPLADIVSTPVPLQIGGLIRSGDSGNSEFALRASLPLDFGTSVVRLHEPALTLRSSLSDERSVKASEIEISVKLEIAGKEFELYSTFRIGIGFEPFVIGSRASLELPDLGDLAGLIGGDDLAAMLPDSLNDFGGLTVSQVQMAFSPAQKRLAYVSLDVHSTRTWEIIPNTLEISNLFASWLVESPFESRSRKLSCSLMGQLTIGDARIEIYASFPEFVICGALAEETPIKVGDLLAHFVEGIPAPEDSLVISRLNFRALPAQKTFSIAGRIRDFWPVHLGFLEVKLEQLDLSFDYTPNNISVEIVGDVNLNFGGESDVSLKLTAKRPAAGGWIFAGRLTQPLKLVPLVNEFLARATDTVVPLEIAAFPGAFTELQIDQLAISIDTGPRRQYTFMGEFDWDLQFVDGKKISIEALLDIRSSLPENAQLPVPGSTVPAGRTYTGMISGRVAFDDFGDSEFFENLVVTAAYDIGAKQFELKLIKDKHFLNLTIAPPKLTLTFGDTTLTDILTFLVRLVDPSIDDFEFEEPWNELGALSLSGLSLVIDLDAKSVSVRKDGTIELPGVLKPFLTITSLALVYSRKPSDPGDPKNKPSVEIEIAGRFLGKDCQGDDKLGWDALNESPPAVPGKGASLFDLQYLGLGQRVSLAPDAVAKLESISQVMTALRGGAPARRISDRNTNPLEMPGQLLQFNADSGWLIGAQFSLLKMLDMSVIFNDPVIYGLRISMYGPAAKVFAGLEFEILYRRINDTTGVYHVELTVPDVMRQLQFGAVSVTLPSIVLDIFTNGDFKIDCGFPWNNNFDRSFGVEVLPFTGSGGFYFNKLSGETATSLIKPENGLFTPVYEFGLGLKIGVGKSLQKGPLSAEVSITVQGVIEGIVSWYNPNDGSEKTQYYALDGTVAIVARVYGKVDFAVIVIDVEVIARAMIRFQVECYQPIRIAMKAEVSVRASVKILFIRVKFSFQLEVKQSFILPAIETGPAPWMPLPNGAMSPRRPVPAATRARLRSFSVRRFELRDSRVRLVENPTELRWQPVRVLEPIEVEGVPEKEKLILYFRPGFSQTAAAGGGAEQSGSGVVGVALLFIENSIPVEEAGHENFDQPVRKEASSETQPTGNKKSRDELPDYDFDKLVLALLTWAICAYKVKSFSDSAESTGTEGFSDLDVSHQELTEIYHFFTTHRHPPNPDQAFSFGNLTEFLELNFQFEIIDRPLDRSEISATIFPMLPQLNMTVTGDAQPRSFEPDDTGGTVPKESRSKIQQLRFGPNPNELSGWRVIKTQTDTTQVTIGGGFAAPPVGSTFTVGDDAATYHVDEFDRSTGILSFYPEPKSAFAFHADLKFMEGAAPSGHVASQSVAQSLFMDYFSLLIRSGIQRAIDYLEKESAQNAEHNHGQNGPLPEPKTTLGELFSAFNSAGTFRHLAGMTSRYLLHGLRLPRVDATTSADADQTSASTEGLYQQTGQQFSVPAGERLEITLTKPDGLKWIRFLDTGEVKAADPKDSPADEFGPKSLKYALSEADDPDAWKLVGAFAGTDKTPGLSPPPPPTEKDLLQLSPYVEIPEHFTIARTMAWNARKPVENKTEDAIQWKETRERILEFPPNLCDHLKSSADTGTKLTLKHGIPHQEFGGHESLQFTVVTGFRCAAKLTLTIRRIPNTNPSADAQDASDRGDWLTGIYALEGTDTSGAALLDELSNKPNPTPSLFLLQPVVGTSGASAGDRQTGFENHDISVSKPFLLRTNLATPSIVDGNSPPLLVTEPANLLTGISFLRDNYDAGSSGYYLHYSPELPEELFTDGIHTTLTLLLEFSDAATSGNILPFCNCAVLDQEAANIDFDSHTLHFESSNTKRVLNVPPGHIGFRVGPKELPGFRVGPKELPDVESSDAATQLANLYQLLSVRMDETDEFHGSAEGLPIGPLEETSTDGSKRWTWERVVPVYSYAKPLPVRKDPAILPPARLDPYRGVGSVADFRVSWQDIYGNRADSSKPLSFSVRYTDPLIGINQWPAVSETYRFEPGPSTSSGDAFVKLVIELAFDINRFLPAATSDVEQQRKEVRAARDTFQRIYYQVHQPDVRFVIATSVLPEGIDPERLEAARIKQFFTNFVDETFRVLSRLELDPDSQIKRPKASIEIPLGRTAELNLPKSFIFPVTVEVTIHRSGPVNDTLPEIKTSAANLSPNMIVVPPVTVSHGASLAEMVKFIQHKHAISTLRVVDLVTANSSVVGLVAEGARILPTDLDATKLAEQTSLSSAEWEFLAQQDLQTGTDETFDNLTRRLTELLSTQFGKVTNFTGPVDRPLSNTTNQPLLASVSLADLATAIADNAALLQPDAKFSIAGNLRRFAQEFEAAFPGLHVAVGPNSTRRDGNSAAATTSEAPIRAVNLSQSGISYEIDSQSVRYYSIAPISNRLQTGTVQLSGAEQKRFDGVDLNVLAREFLVALEEFLSPEYVVPAFSLSTTCQGYVRKILAHKVTLANAISSQIASLLLPPSTTDQSLTSARRLLRKRLLANLVEGYDVETVMDFDVKVNLPGEKPDAAEYTQSARFQGQPVVTRMFRTSNHSDILDRNSFEFTLSSAELPLGANQALKGVSPATYVDSRLTFFFDTKTPEEYEDISLSLGYRISGLEYDVRDGDHVSSSSLSFILPLNAPGGGDANAPSFADNVPVPIPLRTFPTAPSLVQQRAEPDPDSEIRLENIREWQYRFTYEHLDVAQDTIECTVQYNVDDPKPTPNRSSAAEGTHPLFGPLIHFSTVYPELSRDLIDLRVGGDEKSAERLLDSLEKLISSVTTAWPRTPDADKEEQEHPLVGSFTQAANYLIDEDASKAIQITPRSPLIGSVRAARDSFSSESSIPDRTLVISDLDVIAQQNAWASVSISRNRELADAFNKPTAPADRPLTTNSLFVFRTPEVRFANKVTPLIINDETWNIAEIGAAPGAATERTLGDHLQRMMETILPEDPHNSYALQIGCAYSFSMSGQGNEIGGLTTKLPVVLSERFTIDSSAGNGAGWESLRAELVTAINAWNSKHEPSESHGMYVFSVTLFSYSATGGHETRPLIRIESLILPLWTISRSPEPAPSS